MHVYIYIYAYIHINTIRGRGGGHGARQNIPAVSQVCCADIQVSFTAKTCFQAAELQIHWSLYSDFILVRKSKTGNTKGGQGGGISLGELLHAGSPSK